MKSVKLYSVVFFFVINSWNISAQTTYNNPDELFRYKSFSISANTQPINTGLILSKDDYIYFEVLNKIKIVHSSISTETYGDGEGALVFSGFNKYSNCKHGALVCKVNQSIICSEKLFLSALHPIYNGMCDGNLMVKDNGPNYIAGNYFISVTDGELILDINNNDMQNSQGSFTVNVYTLKRIAHQYRNLFNKCPGEEPGGLGCIPGFDHCEDCNSDKWSYEGPNSIYYHGFNDAFRGKNLYKGCQCIYDNDVLLENSENKGSFDIGFVTNKTYPNTSEHHKHLILDMLPHDLYQNKFGSNNYINSIVYCKKSNLLDISLFLFDVSGSMNDNNKIGSARQAAKSTINTIKQEAQLNSSKPEIGLMVFSGSCIPNPTSLVLPYTDDLNKALSGVDKIPNPFGGTPLPQALDNAKTSLETELKNKGQTCGSLVILSDGQSSCGDIRPPSAYAGVQTNNYCGSGSAGVLRIKYFTVGLSIPPGSVAERDLQFLAATTGGKYFQAKDEKELTRAFQKISRRYIPLSSPQIKGVDASFASLFSSGIGFITNQQYDTALVMFKRYVANNPTDPAGIYNLALANEANERYKSAAKYYEQYLQLVPNAANGQLLRDRIQNLKKDYDEFVSYMKQYLQTDTAYFIQYYNKLKSTPNAVSLTGEFAGFINEKAAYYKNLPDVIETEDPQVKQYSKEVSLAFKNATNTLKTAQTWLDVIPAIGNIYEPLDRLMKRVAK